MKAIIEITEQEIKDLKLIRSYFGEHDKTQLEHLAYSEIDKLVKKLQQAVSCWVFLDKEHLPRHYEKVLVTDGNEVWFAKFDLTLKNFRVNDGEIILPPNLITYWMRVPEIPCT